MFETDLPAMLVSPLEQKYSIERLFVSGAAVSLPAVITAQVAAALFCAAVGHRGESAAIGVAVFTLLGGVSVACICRSAYCRGQAGRRRALVAIVLTAIAWFGIAGVRGHLIARLFQPGILISVAVLLAVLLGVSVAIPKLAVRLPRELDGAIVRRRGLAIVWAAFSLAAVAQGARLSVFMVDVTQTWASAVPPVAYATHHQCLAAYVRAAELSRQGVVNLWDRVHYPDARKQSELPSSTVEQLAPYLEDTFFYPPTFVLAPRAAIAITNSYLDIRTLTYGINAISFLLGSLALVIWIGKGNGLGAALLLPMMWLSFATLLTLQWGQVHLLVVVLAVSGLVLIEKERPALGGLLLAMAFVTKVFPGILILYLIMRHRWRAVVWTFAAVALLILATLIVCGRPTFKTFLYSYLPQLASGEATQPFQRGSQIIVMSGSIRAIPYKLQELGIPIPSGIRWSFSWVYIGVVICLTLVAARRGMERRDRAAHWIALTLMASLAGPAWLPYVFVPGLWLLTLFPPSGRHWLAWTVFLMFAFVSFGPIPLVTPGRGIVAWSLVGPLVAVGFSAWTVFRRCTDNRSSAARHTPNGVQTIAESDE